MALWTIEDLRVSLTPGRCIQLLDDDKDGTEDTAIVEGIRVDSEALFYGHVSRVHSAAAIAANPPPLAKRICLAIASEYAYQRKPELVNAEGNSPARLRYNDAMKQLEAIGSGKLRLDVDGVPEAKIPIPEDASVRDGFVRDGTGPGGF